jgi:ribosomal 50S subunit-associated protein YjgA (DUF615 family)
MATTKTKRETREEMIGVRLTVAEREALEGLASKYGETPAGQLRRLLLNALRAQARKKATPET